MGWCSIVFLEYILNILGAGICHGIMIPIFPYFLIFEVRKKGKVVFNRYIEVFNCRVWLGRLSCWSGTGMYKTSHTKSSKSIISHNAELVEVVISNFQPVITNRFIIMDSVLNVSTKYHDKILMSFWKRFQFFGICWVNDIWYIFIRYIYKVFNIFIVIVN